MRQVLQQTTPSRHALLNIRNIVYQNHSRYRKPQPYNAQSTILGPHIWKDWDRIPSNSPSGPAHLEQVVKEKHPRKEKPPSKRPWTSHDGVRNVVIQEGTAVESQV